MNVAFRECNARLFSFAPMEHCLRSVWVLLALMGAFCTAEAQKPALCAVEGKVFDSLSVEPLAFATVRMVRTGADTTFAGTLTNEKGAFKLESLAPGSYQLEFSFIGYRKKQIGPIILHPEEPLKSLGRISLSATNYQLADVQISDRQDLLLNTIDRKTYSVERNMVSEGGSATDVMKTIPSVEVDMDGNVSLRGSGNVTVLIDGKPSAMTGAGRSAVLQQIPASSIKSIEVITNPSARFDPDGMSGIINIVTKKNKAQGLNGNLSLGIGTHQKYNSSLSLGYRNSHINAYGTYSFRREDRWSKALMSSTTPQDSV